MKNKKRLLILGAGRGQLGLYKAARELGITTIAGTMPHYHKPCIDLSDEVCYMDISNPDEVLEKAKKLNLDGAETCCLDTGISSRGKVCDNLNLIGLTEYSAKMCNDKSIMKKAFLENNVNTAKYFEISSKEELEKALEIIQLPVIIKATDLQGSNGIYIAKSKSEAISGFIQAMEKTKRDYCIVEEYIEGWEFGAQSFVYNGEILFVMAHGDETYMSHTAVPVGHYVPLDVDNQISEKIDKEVKKAIRALKLDNCAVNVDMILRDGEVYLIELTGRVGANCLPELVEINFGVEYYKMIATMAVGENPLIYWEKRINKNKAGLARMIIEERNSGVINEIKNKNESYDYIREITFFKSKGDEINKFENSTDCIGQVIVEGNSLENCEDNMDKVISNIKIDIKC